MTNPLNRYKHITPKIIDFHTYNHIDIHMNRQGTASVYLFLGPNSCRSLQQGLPFLFIIQTLYDKSYKYNV
jgi:hypothetical protein